MSENSKTLLLSDLLEEEDLKPYQMPAGMSRTGVPAHALVEVPEGQEAPIDAETVARYGIPSNIGAGLSQIMRTKALKPYALRMYCDHYPTKRIARLLSIEADTIRAWISAHKWHGKRSELEAKYHDAIISQKAQVLGEVMSSAIDIIAQAMKNVSKQKDVSLKDARDVSEIFKNMDKVLRLTHGSPTDILEKRHAEIKMPKNIKEIQEVLRNDPFMTIDITPSSDESSDET